MKLNLGSDSLHYTGYANVDISSDCHPDIIADVANLPLADETVKEIIAFHILEHVPCQIDALGEWWRVLQPGGLITVAIPDFLRGYHAYRTGRWTLEYFNATIYGAQQIWDVRAEYAHRQVFSAEMLIERMQPYFPDAEEVVGCSVREATPDEAMVQGHKPKA